METDFYGPISPLNNPITVKLKLYKNGKLKITAALFVESLAFEWGLSKVFALDFIWLKILHQIID